MTNRYMKRREWIVLAAVGLAMAPPRPAGAWPRYNDGCQDCHGRFKEGVSTKGTIFPHDDKHRMHEHGGAMATHCDLCHTDGDDHNPYIGSSKGRSGIPGVGCNGCHGRDYGGDTGVSGVGLRALHARMGLTSCASCHMNDLSPLPENVPPPYYGTSETQVDDPCNSSPDRRENWSIGDTLGLDNDGDGLIDAADPDCGGLAGDVDGDGDVDLADYRVFARCVSGPSVTTLPPECAPADFARTDADGDNDVDLRDGLSFQGEFTGSGGGVAAPLPGQAIAFDLIGIHDPGSDSYDGDCIGCHGERTNEVALDGRTPTAHSRMLWLYAGYQGNDRCVACHESGPDFLTFSRGGLRKQVSMEMLDCAACHGPSAAKPFYAQ